MRVQNITRLFLTVVVLVVGFSRAGISKPVIEEKASKASRATGKPHDEKHSSSVQSGKSAAPVRSSTFDASFMEELVFEEINVVRRRMGLRPFERDQVLARVARAHSADMAKRNFFSHGTPGKLWREKSFSDRLREGGASLPRLAENIAMLPVVRSRRTLRRSGAGQSEPVQVSEDRTSYQELAKNATHQWMESPGHRKNIVNPDLVKMGLGVAVGKRQGEDYVYLTQDLGGH